MVDEPAPLPIIAPTVPDYEVSAEKIETATAVARKFRRARRFLKGPIPLSWIREHIRDPADRLLLVILAHADMQSSAGLRVDADILRDARIDGRKLAYRALYALETSGTLTVERKRGRRPVVRLKVAQPHKK